MQKVFQRAKRSLFCVHKIVVVLSTRTTNIQMVYLAIGAPYSYHAILWHKRPLSIKGCRLFGSLGGRKWGTYLEEACPPLVALGRV